MTDMPHHILCVQLADIGDLVLTAPALRDLRVGLPDADITLLTTPHAAPVIDSEDLQLDVLTFDKHTFDSPRALLSPTNAAKLRDLVVALRHSRFDTVIFFHHFSTWFGVLKFIGMAAASGARMRVGLRGDRTPFLNAGVQEGGFGAHHQSEYWRRLVAVVVGDQPADLGSLPIAQDDSVAATLPTGVPLVVMHAGSGGYATARRWDPANFAAVARHLTDGGAHVVFVGGPGDDTPAVLREPGISERVTDLTGQTTLPQLAGVLARADQFIGADSGVMQLAAAVGTPTVALFGPSNHQAWGPPDGAVVRSAPRCAPCSYVRTSVGLREGCAARTCMRMITPAMVLSNVATPAGLASLPSAPDNPVALLPPPRVPPDRERVTILGVPVDKLTYAALLDHIGVWINARDGLHHLCTVNPEFVMIAQRDVNFFNILSRADLCLPDGIGLVYAARYLGEHVPERVTGSDGVPAIAERAAAEGWRIYMLGAWEGVADRAAAVLQARYPGVQIVGTYSGSPRPEDEDAIVERVNAAKPDILLVAYGAPVQDKWIARNAPRLNAAVAMGVGGTFDYLAGDVPLAPGWIRRIGFEWLFRLVRQPWRARRQLRLPAFVIATLLWRRRPIRHR
jgi:N-acetylglucosaminyldiphosphoundecaprenol N-acetyl-beta-D-mannosaminyltransferase